MTSKSGTESTVDDRLAALEAKVDRMLALHTRLEALLDSYLSGGRGAALAALVKIHKARSRT